MIGRTHIVTYRPDVNLVVVLGAREEDLWRTVPPRDHVLGQLLLAPLECVLLSIVKECQCTQVASRRRSSQVVTGRCHSTTTYLKPAETKVTDLHIARGRHEHVARHATCHRWLHARRCAHVRGRHVREQRLGRGTSHMLGHILTRVVIPQY